MQKRVLIVVLLVLVTKLSHASGVALEIDNTHSSVQFSVPFFGVSEVTGRFERFCGRFYLDETNMQASHLELFIDASSINTGLKVRDRDLVEKYLGTRTHPIIYYKSKSVRLTKQGAFDVIGELTLHGVVRELGIRLTTVGDIGNEGERELGVRLQPLKINRRDYGIMEGTMGSGSVGDTVTVSAIIRVRDVSGYREKLDKQYPETKSNNTLPWEGSYRSDRGGKVVLVSDKGNYFLAFADDDWSWFAQAKVVGPNQFKLLSFSKVIELNATGFKWTDVDEGEESFAKVKE